MIQDVFDRMHALKRKIQQIIEYHPESTDEPHSIYYKQDIVSPKYKVTITLIEEDFLIDSKGRKWIKAPQHGEEE